MQIVPARQRKGKARASRAAQPQREAGTRHRQQADTGFPTEGKYRMNTSTHTPSTTGSTPIGGAEYAGRIRAVLEAVEDTSLPAASVEIAWHNLSDDDALAVVRAFPDAGWGANSSGATEWLSGRLGVAKLTVFLATPMTPPSERAKAVLAAADAQAVAS